jgi:putative transposase
MIAPEAELSVSRQCALLGIARSSFYYRPRPEAVEELDLLKRLDRIFTDHPVSGSRRCSRGREFCLAADASGG